MYKLGVTGNIGSGKTTAAKILAEFGAEVSHSDDLAKDLIRRDPQLIGQIKARFGDDVYDRSGVLRPALLAERAFKDPAQQQILNQIVHPAVAQASQELMQSAQAKGTTLFIMDSPLLFEAGADRLLDSVLVVVAAKQSRQDRVAQRSGIPAEDFNRRDKLQMPIEEKIKRAQHVIHNDGDIADLRIKLKILFDQITQVDGREA